MEEAPDDQYVESEKEDAPAETPEAPAEAPAEAPETPVCKPVKKNLKEKVQCACGRWMSEHTYRYQHKCKAQSVAEASAPAPEELDGADAARRVRDARPCFHELRQAECSEHAVL